MVVDDVEDDADAAAVRRVDEAPEVVGRAVQVRRRKQVDAVVAPAEPPLELGDRHHLDHVMPMRASSGSSRAAAAHVPSRVKVPTCIS